MSNKLALVNEIIRELDQRLIDAYGVGPLMYSPATNDNIYSKLVAGEWGTTYSLALCLEDSIDDDAVEQGEKTIIETFRKIYDNQDKISYLPKIFIRVRYPEQISRLCQNLGETISLLKGFTLPKFVPENAEKYINEIKIVNENSSHTIYMMPILESGELVSLNTRHQALEKLHSMLIECKEYVLNIRVGGNDLCHIFGIRRNANETIYDIHPIANILGDIVTYFFEDFVISGPVWEYFADENDNWKTGLENEVRMDMLNGFVGKTIIHPNQIEVVANSMKANQHDLADAISILTFKHDLLKVSKSASGTRMNEMKTHTNWAKKQIILAKIYGVR